MRLPRTLLAGGALAFAALLPCAASAAAQPDNVGRLLDQSRAALGGPALSSVKVLELKAKTTAGGLPGTNTQWMQIGGILFSESDSNPPIESADGYDGKVAWVRDGSGLVWVDGSTSGRSQAISMAFASNYALWSANRGGATVSWGGAKTVAGRTYDTLEITAPQSSIPFEMSFDRTTHLPARIEQSAGPVTSTTVLSNYHRVGGIMVPFTVHNDQGGNPSDSSVEQALVNPAGGQSHFAKPPSTVHDFSIAGSTQTTVPFHLGENHVYLS